MKKVTINLNISNKMAYTLMVLAVLVIAGGIVYAYNSGGPASYVGHSAEEIEGVAFGGMYEAGEQSTVGPGCETANPLTGDCSCPDGFIDAALSVTCEHGGCNVMWDAHHFCYKE